MIDVRIIPKLTLLQHTTTLILYIIYTIFEFVLLTLYFGQVCLKVRELKIPICVESFLLKLSYVLSFWNL